MDYDSIPLTGKKRGRPSKKLPTLPKPKSIKKRNKSIQQVQQIQLVQPIQQVQSIERDQESIIDDIYKIIDDFTFEEDSYQPLMKYLKDKNIHNIQPIIENLRSKRRRIAPTYLSEDFNPSQFQDIITSKFNNLEPVDIEDMLKETIQKYNILLYLKHCSNPEASMLKSTVSILNKVQHLLNENLDDF